MLFMCFFPTSCYYQPDIHPQLMIFWQKTKAGISKGSEAKYGASVSKTIRSNGQWRAVILGETA